MCCDFVFVYCGCVVVVYGDVIDFVIWVDCDLILLRFVCDVCGFFVGVVCCVVVDIKVLVYVLCVEYVWVLCEIC